MSLCRIIIVSAYLHKLGSINWDDPSLERIWSTNKAYCQTKLANILHGRELAKRLEGENISVYMLHPGKYSILTNIDQDFCRNI